MLVSQAMSDRRRNYDKRRASVESHINFRRAQGTPDFDLELN